MAQLASPVFKPQVLAFPTSTGEAGKGGTPRMHVTTAAISVAHQLTSK